MDLARSDFVDRRENVIALGPSGVGKTHVAIALGVAACQRGIKTRFATAAAIVHELIEAHDEKRLLRLQRQLASHELLIIDELGIANYSTPFLLKTSMRDHLTKMSMSTLRGSSSAPSCWSVCATPVRIRLDRS